MNATTLINDSIKHDRIEHAPFTFELEAELLALSEDSVETAECVDIWGTDDYGDEWRVTLDK